MRQLMQVRCVPLPDPAAGGAALRVEAAVAERPLAAVHTHFSLDPDPSRPG